MKIIEEFSAGGVVLNLRGTNKEIILISRKQERKAPGIVKIWCLPKGKIEKNETNQEAAVREVEEETGIKARIIKPCGIVSYSFFRQKNINVKKTVYFYLMEKVYGSINKLSNEVEDVKWIAPDKACLIMAYSGEIQLMKKISDV